MLPLLVKLTQVPLKKRTLEGPKTTQKPKQHMLRRAWSNHSCTRHEKWVTLGRLSARMTQEQIKYIPR